MKPADQMKVVALSFFSLAILIAMITTVSIITNQAVSGHGGEHGTEAHQSSNNESTAEQAAPKTEEHAAPKTEEHATATKEQAAPKTEEHAAPKTEEHKETKLAVAGDAKAGAEVFKAKTCSTCHTISSLAGATGAVGPKLDGLGKTAATRVTGKDAVTYIKESIENPTTFVVEGFPPAMPALKATMNEKEFEDLVAYLVSL
ncbi:hypothetical protein COW36_00780 [bacterium (Candidatus Blackallbacteria) CG17_big_fil_post_rev_8_21_14_2_50_48_46]|uniref:Cytochrome c domain-containing protein n=1 Tax=bacterium (Candidatus Blackallbacteria) CG17_big_fil_post_rev_8_21_14_2_50_48_46 TaxID=2014261 RepID=A0A2M7GB49_9BACT|nr:MAG: hypothetical protein COW64_10395 [bacterium (Candidatus Blackallbacteria) CG18_big_fil_WC_8_21_14_2_50_49_26]PIW19405.1 MAG: hypothetical protein COW36_00780 [bacterium (Candidatus Blackallbacteria) CG17_big_fil_post_rev_8_21_14_2_50_48_46]PIW48991.1 MAG: hypothetical protein COW20_07675 [bacterium (Candidatus Blackallbacteria) CG13_big_fil_rev_8_21_14_2_50_49_14]